MNKQQLQQKIKELTEQRTSLLIEVNNKLGYVNGQIDTYQALLDELDKEETVLEVAREIGKAINGTGDINEELKGVLKENQQ